MSETMIVKKEVSEVKNKIVQTIIDQAVNRSHKKDFHRDTQFFTNHCDDTSSGSGDDEEGGYVDSADTAWGS